VLAATGNGDGPTAGIRGSGRRNDTHGAVRSADRRQRRRPRRRVLARRVRRLRIGSVGGRNRPRAARNGAVVAGITGELEPGAFAVEEECAGSSPRRQNIIGTAGQWGAMSSGPVALGTAGAGPREAAALSGGRRVDRLRGCRHPVLEKPSGFRDTPSIRQFATIWHRLTTSGSAAATPISSGFEPSSPISSPSNASATNHR